MLLTRHRVYILPTPQGLLFGLMLLVMLLGSLNYSSNTGFALTFLLGGMGLVCILHTYHNLAGLTLRAGRVDPVFAGQQARFAVCLESSDGRSRWAVAVGRRGGASHWLDVPASEPRWMTLEVDAPHRGRLALGAFSVATRYPLGLFRAWSFVDLDMTCLVYPAPAPRGALPPESRTGRQQGAVCAGGADDFLGFRNYHRGDPPRHLNWKALAREQGLHTKVFADPVGSDLWLAWDDLAGWDGEARLGQLCRWVLDAEAQGRRYGLRLPGRTMMPGQGRHHLSRCLEALALWGALGTEEDGAS